MGTDVTRAAGETAPRRVEGASRGVREAGWRRVAVWVADYELLFILIPVGAAFLVNQLPWRWVVGSWAIIPVAWLARWVARGQLTVRTPLNIPIVMLGLMTGVALYPSVDLSLTFPVLTKLIASIALFFAIVNTADSEGALWGLAGALLVSGVGIAVVGLGNTGWVSSKLFALPALYSRLPQFLGVLNPLGFNRNIVGGTLGMLLPFCIALVIAPPRVHHSVVQPRLRNLLVPQIIRPFASLATLIVGGIVVLTQSRGALTGVVVAIFILLSWWTRWAVVLVPIAIGALFVAIQRLGLQTVLDFFLITDVSVSSQGRFELWQRAIYMLQDFPYTGIGLGTFPRVTPVLYPLFLIGPDAEVPHAHNLYLQVGVDLGIPGLVAHMAIVSTLLLISVSAWQHARHTPFEGVAVGCSCGFVVYLVHGLVDSVTFGAKPMIVLWALIGLATALWLYLGNQADSAVGGLLQ